MIILTTAGRILTGAAGRISASLRITLETLTAGIN
jgi:hypothetical protein